MWLGVLLLGLGCAPRGGPPPLTWDFDARPTTGEVRVLPVLARVDPGDVSRAAWVAALPDDRVALRAARTAQLGEVPAAIGLAVPGAVGAALGDSWDGRFRAASFPVGARARLRAAVTGRADLYDALGDVATRVGGDATLLVWVDEVVGDPITAEGPPGELVRTGAGPVLVDPVAEPYRVTARVGVALVASDGEVVLRYLDRYEAILSELRDPAHVGRAVAQDVAAELATVWPTEAALMADAEP